MLFPVANMATSMTNAKAKKGITSHVHMKVRCESSMDDTEAKGQAESLARSLCWRIAGKTAPCSCQKEQTFGAT
jgi:hypothetical protein